MRKIKKSLFLILILINFFGCLNEKTKENEKPELNSILANGNSSLEVVEGEPLKITLETKDAEGDVVEIILSEDWEKEGTEYVYQKETIAGTDVELKIELNDGKNIVTIKKDIKVVTEEDSSKELTFLIYLAADNNLNEMANRDIEEIKKANINGENINVVIYGDFTNVEDPGIFVKDGYEVKKVQTLNEFNTGDPENLKKAINYVKENYPAKRYVLDVWNHGNGWYDDKYGNKNNPSKAIASDDSSYGDSLDLWEFESAIKDSDIPKFDIIYMDACLMGGIEVSYQLKDVADYLAFSPELTPGQGGDYTGILESINNNLETTTVKNIAIKIQEENLKSYQLGGRQYYDETYIEALVYTVVDQSKVQELFNKFDLISEKILNLEILALDKNNILYYNYENDNYNIITEYVDIIDLLNEIKGKTISVELISEINEFINFFENEYRVYLDYQDGHYSINEISIEKGTSGLSIYFNFNENIDSTYENATRFGRESKWLDVLKKYDI